MRVSFCSNEPLSRATQCRIFSCREDKRGMAVLFENVLEDSPDERAPAIEPVPRWRRDKFVSELFEHCSQSIVRRDWEILNYLFEACVEGCFFFVVSLLLLEFFSGMFYDVLDGMSLGGRCNLQRNTRQALIAVRPEPHSTTATSIMRVTSRPVPALSSDDSVRVYCPPVARECALQHASTLYKRRICKVSCSTGCKDKGVFVLGMQGLGGRF
ncbi:hypothetical protein CEXT_433891 [Caerostris extrusa]|uniref:Uncharacterized protein n=1 Tax=Caerostris extrusa TaxID=172846 RepID=A0AAV4WB03_CAEEX|nr:hypothetical protein CEXT_433891 [Caerostris extrusa]